jgi:hypothetical protein
MKKICEKQMENQRLKSRIYSRTRSRIQKGVSPWIRGLEKIVWWQKTEGRISRDTVSLKNVRNYKDFQGSMTPQNGSAISLTTRKISKSYQQNHYLCRNGFLFSFVNLLDMPVWMWHESDFQCIAMVSADLARHKLILFQKCRKFPEKEY